MIKPILLQSPRLLLRPLSKQDLETFAEYRSDPEVARYQGWTAPYSMQMAEEFYEKMKLAIPGNPGVWYQLGIERLNCPGIIGDCAFKVSEDDGMQAMIGYTFSRAHQKQGYATEAVGCLLDYLFNRLNLRRVSAICDVENTASYKLLERVGMRREAHFIENVWFKGAWGSEYGYAILQREWKEK